MSEWIGGLVMERELWWKWISGLVGSGPVQARASAHEARPKRLQAVLCITCMADPHSRKCLPLGSQ